MLRRVALVRTDVSEELSASFIKVTIIGERGTTIPVTAKKCRVRRLLVTASVVPRSPRLWGNEALLLFHMITKLWGTPTVSHDHQTMRLSYCFTWSPNWGTPTVSHDHQTIRSPTVSHDHQIASSLLFFTRLQNYQFSPLFHWVTKFGDIQALSQNYQSWDYSCCFIQLPDSEIITFYFSQGYQTWMYSCNSTSKLKEYYYHWERLSVNNVSTQGSKVRWERK
jgi:hypothetical protein